MITTTPRQELTDRGRAAALRVADLVRSLSPTEAAAPVPGLGWTAGETAAHVVNLYGRGLGDLRRSATADATATLNARCLDEYAERDPAVVADRIAADAVTVWDHVLTTLPEDLELDFHAGARTTVVPIMGVLLMEMLVHGRDIARATGRPWAIDDADAWHALTALAPLLPAWRRPGTPAADTIALPGPAGDRALRIACDGPATTIEVAATSPEDRVIADGPAMALLGILGRQPATGPVADLAARFGPF